MKPMANGLLLWIYYRKLHLKQTIHKRRILSESKLSIFVVGFVLEQIFKEMNVMVNPLTQVLIAVAVIV